jgi:hypothetical protein
MPMDAADEGLSLPTFADTKQVEKTESGVAAAPHTRIVTRAVVEPLYALCTFAAVVTVGDPIMVRGLRLGGCAPHTPARGWGVWGACPPLGPRCAVH